MFTKQAVLVSLMLLTLFTHAHGQSPGVLWSRLYGGSGGDAARDLIKTSEGGFLIAGSTENFGAIGVDIYVVKTDSAGIVDWEKSIGGVETDRAYSALETLDGDYLLAGASNSFNASAVDQGILYRLDEEGSVLWFHVYGDTTANTGFTEVLSAIDDGYILAGNTYDRFYLLKVDEQGEVIWERTYDTGSGIVSPNLSTAIATSDSSYLLAGRDGEQQFQAIKVDIYGNIIWEKDYGPEPPCLGYFLAAKETPSGLYALAGMYGQYYPPYWYGGSLHLLTKDGNVIWDETYAYEGNDRTFLRAISQYSQPVQTLTAVGDTDFDVYFMQASLSTGNKLSELTWGGSASDKATSIVYSGDYYFVAGITNSYGAGSSDAFLLKIGEQVGISEEESVSASGSLHLIPSPFSTELQVAFELEEFSQVSLHVYDLAGRVVCDLEDGYLTAGSYEYLWHPNSGLANGCYSVVLEAGECRSVQRCVRIR